MNQYAREQDSGKLFHVDVCANVPSVAKRFARYDVACEIDSRGVEGVNPRVVC